ncbi:MAG: MBL fold metallo-hydrolase [Planctomycetota bacterium]|jgi:glyoxylase-like metal-dependent hydrolase (beta-lactamase superfamily II)
MIVEPIVVGMFQENTWVVVCEETREAVIIDPGDEAERIADLLEQLDATPARILNTHAHLDHVGGVADLKERFGIPFAVHEGERENLANMRQHAMLFGMSPPPVPEVDEWIEEGQVFPVGNASLTAIETPGHTTGGVTFLGTGFALVGDTLFAGSIGRTDLPGGDFSTLKRSIRERLFTLPPETVAHSGHGPDTTIGVEKMHNPFVGDNADLSGFGIF